MSKKGYLYILIRSDFIEKKKYIYKIGQTARFPPHCRLWEYPFGSLFLQIFETKLPIQFEKEVKNQLSKNINLNWRKDIGVEYFEGSLQIIMNQIINIYQKFIPENIKLEPITHEINDEYLLKLNRLNYIVNYDDLYFKKIYQQQFYYAIDNIPSEKIYDSYQNFRKWYAEGYQDNYVIRYGMISIKPPNPIYYNVPQQIKTK